MHTMGKGHACGRKVVIHYDGGSDGIQDIRQHQFALLSEASHSGGAGAVFGEGQSGLYGTNCSSAMVVEGRRGGKRCGNMGRQRASQFVGASAREIGGNRECASAPHEL